MSMIRGEIRLDREVVSRRVSIGGDAPFRRMDNGDWVDRAQPETKMDRITLADVLGREKPQENQKSRRDKSGTAVMVREVRPSPFSER